MEHRTLSLIAGLAVATAGGLPAQTLPTDRIDSVFAGFDRTDRPGCAVGVYRGGQLAYARGYGMANLEYGVALQPRAVFHVASISKQFTAFAVELLVAEGRVSWDDPIQRYVPEIPEYGTPITLRHLAHHISGIRDQWDLLILAGWRWEADLVTQANAIEIMSRQTALNFPPGDEYLYSNSGFTLLAAVVERVSGQSLREFTTERIFEPLGMTSTHFHDDHQMIVRDRAYGYQYAGRREGWKISIPDFDIVGATSLFTTVEDMARWDRNLRDHLLGDEELYRRFLDRGILNNGDTLTYAHGIVVSTYRGQATVGHSGADAGYRSNYLRFPDLDVGIAAFCNFARANPSAYVNAVADAILAADIGPAEPAPDDTDAPAIDTQRWASTWRDLEGFFRGPRSDIPVHVWIDHGRARTRNGIGGGRSGDLLVPDGEDAFHLWPSGTPLRVIREGGRVRALESRGNRLAFVGKALETTDPAPYLGTYRSDELGTEYHIVADTGQATLEVTHRTLAPRRFRTVYPDGFASGGQWITFVRDAAGTVVGFTLSTGRTRRVRFVRQP